MARSLKALLKKIPVVGPMARQVYFRFFASSFSSSGSYWETRYKKGGNSGAGSYDRLAHFKAEVLNDFVRRNGVRSVVELGCGDGSQIALADYPEYVGVDVSPTALDLCRARFADDGNKQFVLDVDQLGRTFDLSLSLDVIYHLIEDNVFEDYMAALFDLSHTWVIIYSSNSDEPVPEPHIRHRRFVDWVRQNRSAWVLLEKIENRFPYDSRNPDFTSFADFYIYQLVKTAPEA